MTSNNLTFIPLGGGSQVQFYYTNYKNERELRTVSPVGLEFGTIEGYHNEPTWLLRCLDHERKAQRSFDLSRIEMETFIDLDNPAPQPPVQPELEPGPPIFFQPNGDDTLGQP